MGWNTILDAVTDKVRGLVLTGITPSNVARRMLPTAQSRIDALPCIRVCQAGKERVTDAAFGDYADHEWPVLVCVIDRNNDGFAAREPQYLDWVDKIRKALLHSTLGGTAVWDTKLEPAGDVLDKDLLLDLYAYLPTVVTFVTHEKRV